MYERYFGSRIGRTFVITGILVLIFGYLAVIIPLAPANNNAWYSFLYKDVTLDPADRFNAILVILEALLLTLFYFFLVVALGSYAEVNNRIPSWTELVLAAIISVLLSYLLPQISIGQATLVNNGTGTGTKHFTPKMQLWVFLGTLVGIILSSLYIFYSAPKEE